MKRTLQRNVPWALGLCAVLTVIAAVLPSPAAACTPFPPTPWFLAQTHLLETNLPSEIQVADQHDGSVLLFNSGRSGINIIISPELYQTEGGQKAIAPGGSAIFMTDGDDNLDVDGRLITFLAHRNVIGDNRPADAQLPDPQVAWVQVISGKHSYYIQLQVSYRLNEQYIPDSVYAADHLNCPEYGPVVPVVPLVGFLLGLLAVFIAGFLILRLRSTPSRRTDQEETAEIRRDRDAR